MARAATAAVRLLTGEREPVRFATTGPITLSGLQVVDDGQTEPGDRVLVKDQPGGVDNRIYTASAGPWFVASDSRDARAIQKGTTVHVQSGTVNAGKVFVFQTDAPRIGEDPIVIDFFTSDDAVADFNTAVAEAVGDAITAVGDVAQPFVDKAQAWAESSASPDGDPANKSAKTIAGEVASMQAGVAADKQAVTDLVAQATTIVGSGTSNELRKPGAPALNRSNQSYLNYGMYAHAHGTWGDGETFDAQPAIQAMIEDAMDFQLGGYGVPPMHVPPGKRSLGFPLKLYRYDPVARSFYRISPHLILGAGVGAYQNLNQSSLQCQFNDLPAIIIAGVRNARVIPGAIYGKARAGGPIQPTYRQTLEDTGAFDPWWNPGGLARDTQWNPHSCIIIDPFHGTSPSGADRLGGGLIGEFNDIYASLNTAPDSISNGAGASRMIAIEHGAAANFIVGVFSGASGSLVDDMVRVRDMDLTYNKVGVVNGHSQGRSMVLQDNRMSVGQVYVDTRRYGQGQAPMPEVRGALLEFLKACFLSTGQGQSQAIRGVYTESVHSIGEFGAGHTINFEACHFKLIDGIDNTTGVPPSPMIDVHLKCDCPVTFNGGYVGFNTNNYRRLNIINGGSVRFDGNVQLDGVPFFKEKDLAEFPACRVRFGLDSGSAYGIIENFHGRSMGTVGGANVEAKAAPGWSITSGVGNSFQKWQGTSYWDAVSLGSVAVTVDGNGGATFTATDTGVLKVGMYLESETTVWNAETPLGPTVDARRMTVGKILTIVGSTVTLDKCPKGFVSGTYSLQTLDLPTIRQPTIGFLTNGSASVTGITPTAGWKVGSMIKGTGIPVGTYITAISGTTFTLSKNATATSPVEGTYLFDAEMEVASAKSASAPASGVYPPDTYVNKIGKTKDASNMVLAGWTQTKVGSPGTWEPDYRSAVSPAT